MRRTASLPLRSCVSRDGGGKGERARTTHSGVALYEVGNLWITIAQSSQHTDGMRAQLRRRIPHGTRGLTKFDIAGKFRQPPLIGP
jgi:hypothetical protein